MASSSSHHLHLLPLSLLAVLLLPFISCDGNDLIINQCIGVANNQSSPTLADKMLSDLVSLAPENDFAYTYHLDSGLYGLAWCRGDFSADNCSSCLGKAAGKFTDLCSHEAVVASLVFQDFCYFRIDTEDFFMSLDIKFGRILYNPNEEKIAEELKHWASVNKLLGEMKEAIPQEKRRFVKMKVDFEEENSKIHGMGQCLKGISGETCKACLDQAVKAVEYQCMYHRECEAFYGSCFLQYYTKKY